MKIKTLVLALAALTLVACGDSSAGSGITVIAPPAPKDPQAIATLDKLKAMGTPKERQDYMRAHQDETMRLHSDPGAYAEAHKLAFGDGGGAAAPLPSKG